MKNQYLILLCFTVIIVAGCRDKKTVPAAVEPVADTIIVTDNTVYGTCGEGTAMHTLELVTDSAGTVTYSLAGPEDGTEADVQGGLLVGDRVAVLADKEADGVLYASKVINLSSLLGRWTSLDKTFEICEDGAVISNVREPKPYTEWRILNGKLILSADTFEIEFLGKDSLYLINAGGRCGYRRLAGSSVK